jgi:hypothetical protein
MPLGVVKLALLVQRHGSFIMLPGGPAGLGIGVTLHCAYLSIRHGRPKHAARRLKTL